MTMGIWKWMDQSDSLWKPRKITKSKTCIKQKMYSKDFPHNFFDKWKWYHAATVSGTIFIREIFVPDDAVSAGVGGPLARPPAVGPAGIAGSSFIVASPGIRGIYGHVFACVFAGLFACLFFRWVNFISEVVRNQARESTHKAREDTKLRMQKKKNVSYGVT